MIEDIMDNDGMNAGYKQQPPLRPPPMNPSTSVRASVSPRFDNLVSRSSSVPWSPAPVDGSHYDRTPFDPLATNQNFSKTSDVWTNNNNNNNSSYLKSPDVWPNNNPYPKPSDGWPNNNAPTKTSDMWSNNNGYTKSTEVWSMNNNNSYIKSPGAWPSNNPNPYPKSPDVWSPNNTFTKINDVTTNSNNSSNAQMIKSSDSTCCTPTDKCSPRCKLGILGFIIGLLAVSIPLAVVLVLWLRQ